MLDGSLEESCDDPGDDTERNDPQRVKALIIEKVNKSTQTFSNKYKISEEHVKKFGIKGVLGHCAVECPYPNFRTKVPCTYDSHWIISNLRKHIRNHFVNAHRPQPKSNLKTLKPNQPTTPATTLVSTQTNVLAEVDRILK